MGRKRVQPTYKELEELKHNPFVNKDFIIRVRKRNDGRTFSKDESGEYVPKEYDQEIEPCTRVYNSSEVRQRIAKLSAPAAALLLWIQQELEAGKDYVVINRSRYMKEHDHKTDYSFKEGMIELTRYLFITPTVLNDVYWINPAFMFNGNRIMKYRKHTRRVD